MKNFIKRIILFTHEHLDAIPAIFMLLLLLVVFTMLFAINFWLGFVGLLTFIVFGGVSAIVLNWDDIVDWAKGA